MKQLMLVTPGMAAEADVERYQMRCLSPECWAHRSPIPTKYRESAERAAHTHVKAHGHEAVVEEIE